MISIITPTYNRGNLLPRMINSVLSQSYKDWELIIIDDGSKDNTKDIVSVIEDNRIKYFYKENSGAPASRNIGVTKAIGQFIIFLDSDDEAKSNWLMDLHNKMEEDKATVACCGLQKHDHLGQLIEVRLPKNQGSIFNNIVINFLSGSLLMKKDYFLEAGGYDIGLPSGQHTEILMRLLPVFDKYNVKIANVFEPLVIIHMHQGERIRHDLDAIYRGSTTTLKKHAQLFEKNRDKHYDYLNVAARCAFKTNRIAEGKALVLKAFKIKPVKAQSIIRLIIGFTPIIRRNYWKNVNNLKTN